MTLVQPKDQQYYTGEQVLTLDNGGGIQPKTYEEGDIKVEYIGGSDVYDGTELSLDKSDFRVTDALSGEVLDSEKMIWSITPSSKTDADEYEVTIGLVADGSANYGSSLNNVSITSSTKWTIEKLDLSTCEIFLGAMPANDDGDAVTASDFTRINTITNAAGTVVARNVLLADLGLQISSVQSNNGTAGTYTATIEATSGSQNYTGEGQATFRLYQNGLGGAAFDGEGSTTDTDKYADEPEEYTGEAVTKDITKLGNLVLDGTKLTPGVDYDTNFEYKNNTNAGTAQFIVKGLNTYAGSELTFEFEIKKASVSAADVTAPEKVTYNSDYTEAKDYAPEVTVIAKNGASPAKEFTLVEGTDYTVSYSFEIDTNDVAEDGRNAYDNYVCAHIEIINPNFQGGDDEFNEYSKITKPQVSNWTVSTVSPSYTYTGEAIIPELVVKDGNKELELGVDYEIRSIANGTNVGTATVVLAGKGDYDSDSTIITTFEITPAETEDLVVSVDDMEYTGQRIRPVYVGNSTTEDGITEVKLGDVAIDIDQFNITYPDSASENKEIGTGTFTLTPKSTNKNFTGSKTVTFNIVGMKISIPTDEVEKYLKVYNSDGTEADLKEALLYDGEAHTYADAEFNYIYTDPVTNKSVTLEEGKDFEIKYFHNVYGYKKEGTEDSGTAYIAVIGKGNYAGDGETYVFEDENGQKVNAIAALTFEIDSVVLTSQNVTVSNGEYAEGMPVKPVVTVKYGRDTLTLEEGKDYKLDLSGVYTEPTTSNKYKVTVTGINGYTGKSEDNAWGIDKKDLADCDVTASRDDAGNVSVIVMNGSVVVDSSKYVIAMDDANDTVTVTPAEDSKYYTGSSTVAIQGEDPAEKPAAPVISEVNVSGNNATVVLAGESDGATGYDYVISTDRDCINNKDYDKVNKNILSTETTFTYTQQGVYYAYCHAWKRVDGVKVFSDWSEAYPFSVSAITPEQPVITSVKKSGRNLTVTWTQSENATTGYDVVMGTAVRKVNGELRPVEYGKAVKKVGPNTFSVTFKSIPKGTYYVGLHSHNRTSETGVKVFSPWSNYKTVTF